MTSGEEIDLFLPELYDRTYFPDRKPSPEYISKLLVFGPFFSKLKEGDDDYDEAMGFGLTRYYSRVELKIDIALSRLIDIFIFDYENNKHIKYDIDYNLYFYISNKLNKFSQKIQITKSEDSIDSYIISSLNAILYICRLYANNSYSAIISKFKLLIFISRKLCQIINDNISFIGKVRPGFMLEIANGYGKYDHIDLIFVDYIKDEYKKLKNDIIKIKDRIGLKVAFISFCLKCQDMSDFGL